MILSIIDPFFDVRFGELTVLLGDSMAFRVVVIHLDITILKDSCFGLRLRFLGDVIIGKRCVFFAVVIMNDSRIARKNIGRRSTRNRSHNERSTTSSEDKKRRTRDRRICLSDQGQHKNDSPRLGQHWE